MLQQLPEQCYPLLPVSTESSCVQRLVRLPVFGICNAHTQMLMHAIARGSCGDAERESALKFTLGNTEGVLSPKLTPGEKVGNQTCTSITPSLSVRIQLYRIAISPQSSNILITNICLRHRHADSNSCENDWKESTAHLMISGSWFLTEGPSRERECCSKVLVRKDGIQKRRVSS